MAHAPADEHPRTDDAVPLDQLDADVMQAHRCPVLVRRDHGEAAAPFAEERLSQFQHAVSGYRAIDPRHVLASMIDAWRGDRARAERELGNAVERAAMV